MAVLNRDTELLLDTIASSASSKATAIPGSAIVVANTIAELSHESAQGAGTTEDISVALDESSTTQFTSERFNNPANALDLSISMAEYNPGIIQKQQGMITDSDFTGSAPAVADVTITEVDVRRAFPRITWLTGGTAHDDDDMFTAEIIDSTTLRITGYNVDSGLEVRWTVVEHPFIWVLKHNITIISSVDSATIDFVAEDYSKVLLFGSCRMNTVDDFAWSDVFKIEVDQGNKQILLTRRNGFHDMICVIYSCEVCNNGDVDNVSQDFTFDSNTQVVTFPKTLDVLRTTIHLNTTVNRSFFGGNFNGVGNYRRGYLMVASFTATQATLERESNNNLETDISVQRWDHGTNEIYPIILRIEPDESEISGTSLTSVLDPPNIVDDKTWIVHSQRTSNGNFNNDRLSIKSSVTGVNSLLFDRASSSGGNVFPTSHVIRFDPNVPVETERGLVTNSNAFNGISLSRTFDVNKSWPYLTYEVSGGQLNESKAYTASINGSTNEIELETESGNGGFSGSWQVIEYPYCKVTRIFVTPTGTSQDVLVAGITDWNKVLVQATSRRNNNSNYTPQNIWTTRVDVAGNKIVLERTTSDGALTNLVIYAIEFTDETLVDHESGTITASFQTTTFTDDCDTERTSFHLGSTEKTYQGRVEAGETGADGVCCEIDLIGGFFTPTEIDINRGANTAFDVTYEIQRVRWGLCQPEIGGLPILRRRREIIQAT